jgi:hypothetical protein
MVEQVLIYNRSSPYGAAKATHKANGETPATRMARAVIEAAPQIDAEHGTDFVFSLQWTPADERMVAAQGAPRRGG